MNHFTTIYFIILIRLVSTHPPDQDQSNTTKGLGKAVCGWYGDLPKTCNMSEITVEDLPEECTSFVYAGIRIDIHNKVTDYHPATAYILDEFISTKKNVMMYFGHDDVMEWIKVFNVSADKIEKVAQDQMQSVKAYVDQHEGITGIIVINLERHELHEFIGNIKTYIEVMGKTFPKMEIGYSMESYAPIFYIDNPDSKWLDFKILDYLFDFYIINLVDINNNCTDEFVETGTFPLYGNGSIHSIDEVTNYLDDIGVRICDLYYNFQTYGTFKDTSDESCNNLYPNMCKAKVKSKDNKGICADTLQSFYEKGQYAKAKGRGFIGTIDLDDVDCSCDCSRTFPTFYALLAGFDGSDPPANCPLFDRN